MLWIYRILRTLVVIFGLFVVLAGVIGFVFPEVFYSDNSEIPSLFEKTVFMLFTLFFGLVYLLPYRFTATNYLYWTRLVISILIAIFFIFMAIKGFMGYKQGVKSIEIISSVLINVFFTISLPCTLYWHKVSAKME